MQAIREPLLAETLELTDLESLPFPVWGSPKHDGVRGTKVKGKALTRKFKAIPNVFIRTYIEKNFPNNVDGEIMVPKNDEGSFDTGPVMKRSGEPDFSFHCFDYVETTVDVPYWQRMKDLKALKIKDPRFHKVLPVLLRNANEVRAYHAENLKAGFEGTCIRAHNGPYKEGRSTLKEAYLLRIVPVLTSEAEILDVLEQQQNLNETKKDAFGRIKRSSHKKGKVGKGTFGAFWVRDLKTGQEFSIGTGKGWTKEFRDKVWKNRKKFPGQLLTYSYKKGGKNNPRQPIGLSLRDPRDMS